MDLSDKEPHDRMSAAEKSVQELFADVANNVEIGAMLRAARDRAGLTQGVVAHRMNIVVTHFGNIERGFVGASLKNLNCIAEAIGCHLKLKFKFSEAAESSAEVGRFVPATREGQELSADVVNNVEIGAMLAAARERAGLDQGDVAERMGILTANLRRVERGQIGASRKRLQHIAQAIGAHLEIRLSFQGAVSEGEPKQSEQQTKSDLTARGTPRIRRRKRSREEIGGDPHAEANRVNVKIGGRIPVELRDKFLHYANSCGLSQGKVLTRAIEDFIKKHEL